MIQHQALRLFREQGYEATTIEQIAEAVEVSPSTFFRYFPTKEAVVLTDEYDPLMIETFRAQPPGMDSIEAFRATLRIVFEGLTEDETSDIRDRMELSLAVPELRAAVIGQIAGTIGQITELVAERTGRDRDDFEVSALAGAILGVMVTTELYWAEHPESNLVSLLDDALAYLSSGLVLR